VVGVAAHAITTNIRKRKLIEQERGGDETVTQRDET